MSKNRRVPMALLVAVLWLGAIAMPNTFSSFSGSANHATTGASKSAFQCEAYQNVVTGTPGMTNWWHFGETTGTTAVDSATGPSATPYNLSYRNTPTRGVTRTSEESNKSVSFNGTNQFIDSNTQRFNYPGTAAYSVEGWAYISSNPKQNNERVISAENLTQFGNGGGRYGWNITYQKASTSLRFERWENTASQRTAVTVTKLDAWHHFAATFDGTTINFYVDGVAATPDSNTVSLSPLANNYGMRIGSTGAAISSTGTASSDQWWTGGIDEIAFYNRALTQKEAYEHATANCRYKSVVHRENGSQNNWYLDESRGATTVADSKQDATCDVAGAVNFGDIAGLASGDGTSATFTGGRLTCPTATIFNGNAPFSVEVWVNMAQLPTNKAYIIGNKVPTGDGWSIYANPDGRVVFDRAVGGVATSITSSNPLPSGWHMLTATFNGSGGTFYIDNTITGGATMNTSINSNAALVIGAATNAVSPWIGGIDNVSLYSRALSASDISNHWAAR